MIKTETKTSRNKKIFRISPILIVLGLGLIVRIVLGFLGTLRLDQGTFIAWSQNLAENGLKHFYNGWSDYLPGYMYALWVLGKIRGVIPDVLLYKLPAMLADLATGFLVYEIVKKLKNQKWGITASALYIFNPAILANSTFWGQIDSITALFSLLAVWLFSIGYPLSAISLAVGTLIKPQAAFILPVLVVLMFKNKWKIRKVFVYGLTSFVVFILGFLPFFAGDSFVSFVVKRLSLSFSQYPYSSVNAFNFWGLFGFWQSDNKPFALVFAGVLIIAILFAFTLFRIYRRKGSEYFLAALIFLASFLFLTRMHERHLLPAFAPLLISAAFVPSLLIPYSGLSLTYLANMYYSYNWITHDFLSIFSPFLIKIFILFNLALLAFTIVVYLSQKKFKFSLPVQKAKMFFPKTVLSTRTIKILLALIVTFSFVSRVGWLGNPQKEYFDEVYHAFTARIILHGDPKAWEWWNPHPEGFAYEWTHPPLAKLGMVLGMKVFGENSFGWRIPGALLGGGSVLLVAGIAKMLFKDDLLAVLSAAVFSLDGLFLVMTRIGMNDSYLLFFALLTIYFFLKNKNFYSALAFGLAISSKWSAIWILPIMGAIWLSRFKDFKFSYFWFLILPPAVYLASYLPMFLTGHNLDIFWGMQKQMWWYHTGLRATHPYTSPWWSWPLLSRPIYLYTSDEIGGFVSRIYATGNPAVFWFGFLAVIYGFYRSFLEKNKPLALVIFSYLIFFVPWAASPRIMFLYHYLPSIPFLSIAIGYFLRRFPKIVLLFISSTVLLFIYFYPHWVGLKVPLWLDSSYSWLSSWR